MIYCFDIDGTICSLKKNSDYEKAEPFSDMVEKINFLYQNGDKIIIMSARGSVSGKDWTEVTANQLCLWGINYHQLIMNKKPHADIFVDDKGMNIVDFTKKHISRKVGFIAGSFDIIHPGYIKLFKEAKQHCNYLIVGLHEDPTFERKNKIKPILSVEERKEILLSLKYVDEVFVYNTEEELYNILKETNIDIRFLGEDYRQKEYTGYDLNIPIYFCSREHGWSTTKIKHLIKETE
jgi:glycerol-3-phosphate cytidylyltransferase